MFYSFCRSHLYRKHHSAITAAGADQEHESDFTGDVGLGDAGLGDGQQDTIADNANDEEADGTSSRHRVDIQRAAALFILKAKEVWMLTQDAIDGILDDTKG